MKTTGLALLGLVAAFACFTLFAPAGLLFVLIGFGSWLYWLFFGPAEQGTPLLIGFCLGLELFSAHRVGVAAVSGLLCYGLYLLFSQQLRFTSLFGRFAVALPIGLLLIPALLYPLREYFLHTPTALLAILVVAGASGLLQRASKPTAYELL